MWYTKGHLRLLRGQGSMMGDPFRTDLLVGASLSNPGSSNVIFLVLLLRPPLRTCRCHDLLSRPPLATSSRDLPSRPRFPTFFRKLLSLSRLLSRPPFTTSFCHLLLRPFCDLLWEPLLTFLEHFLKTSFHDFFS